MFYSTDSVSVSEEKSLQDGHTHDLLLVSRVSSSRSFLRQRIFFGRQVNIKFPRAGQRPEARACVNAPRGSFPRGAGRDESSTYRGKNLRIYEKHNGDAGSRWPCVLRRPGARGLF